MKFSRGSLLMLLLSFGVATAMLLSAASSSRATFSVNPNQQTAAVLESVTNQTSASNLFIENMAVHQNDYWGFSFSYDKNLLNHQYALDNKEPLTEQYFIDQAIDKALEESILAGGGLTTTARNAALAAAADRYEEYLAKQAILSQSTNRRLEGNNGHYLHYLIVPKSPAFDPVFDNDAIQIIAQGSISGTTPLNSNNTYYNIYGEKFSILEPNSAEVLDYQWFYDATLGAIMINWCFDNAECDPSVATENRLEMFPRRSSRLGYYIYDHPFSNSKGDGDKTIEQIEKCVNLTATIVCFEASDKAIIDQAINTLKES